HVVVGYVLGLACNEVALTHDEVDETGEYGYANAPNPYFGYEFSTEADRQATMRAACVSCCGGLAAEHVLFGVPLSTDNKNAAHHIQNIMDQMRAGTRIRGNRGGYIDDDAPWRYIRRLLVRAKKLVQRNREPIQRLAEVLVKKNRLGRDEVERL